MRHSLTDEQEEAIEYVALLLGTSVDMDTRQVLNMDDLRDALMEGATELLGKTIL